MRILMIVPVYFPEHLAEVERLASQAQNSGVDFVTFCNSAPAYVQALRRGLPVAACHDNIGYGGAANFVAARESFDWLVLCNDDLLVRDSDFAAFVGTLRSLRVSDAWTVGLIDSRTLPLHRVPGPGAVFTNMSLIGAVGAALRRRGALARRLATVNDPISLVEVTSGTAFPFVCVGISSTCWMNLGGFDPNFPLYFEDMDFLIRGAEKQNHRFAIVPSRLAHGHSTSTRKTLPRMIPILAWSACEYLTRDARLRRLTARTLLCVALLVRMIVAPAARGPLRDHAVGIFRGLKTLAINRKPDMPPWDPGADLRPLLDAGDVRTWNDQ